MVLPAEMIIILLKRDEHFEKTVVRRTTVRRQEDNKNMNDALTKPHWLILHTHYYLTHITESRIPLPTLNTHKHSNTHPLFTIILPSHNTYQPHTHPSFHSSTQIHPPSSIPLFSIKIRFSCSRFDISRFAY